MKSKLFVNKIIVKRSSIHGYGVFAEKAIKKGEKVEDCYAILCRSEDDVLIDYFFNVHGKNAILTGFGMIYNHSDEPNLEYNWDKKNRIMVFKAIKPIKKGEEIYVSYGDEWFKSRDTTPKNPSLKKKFSKRS